MRLLDICRKGLSSRFHIPSIEFSVDNEMNLVIAERNSDACATPTVVATDFVSLAKAIFAYSDNKTTLDTVTRELQISLMLILKYDFSVLTTHKDLILTDGPFQRGLWK